jgi:hypothetical protein
MRFDIRLPIGLLFSLIGLLLAGFGAYVGESSAAGSRGLNVNLWWGLAMLAFGLVMLALARRLAHRSTNAT